MHAGAEHSSQEDKGWGRRLDHQRQEIRIVDPEAAAVEQLARMGLALGYCWGHFQKVAHRLVGSQRERRKVRRKGLLPSKNR